MIYVNSESNLIVLPKYKVSTVEKLVLKNNLTNKVSEFEVEDLTPENLYYTFELDFSELIEGEYSYKIEASEVILASGLLQVGEYNRTKNEYEKDNTIITYNG